MDINDYIVEAGAAHRGRSHPRAHMPWAAYGGGGGSSTTGLLIAIVVLLIIVVGVACCRRLYASKPDCSKGSPAQQAACHEAVGLCSAANKWDAKGEKRCLNAVAHCLPLLDPPGGALDTRHVRACANAVSRIDPAQAAAFLGAHTTGACLSPEVAAQLGNEKTFHSMMAVARGASRLAPYSLEVARHLPHCGSAPSMMPVSPPMMPVSSPMMPVSSPMMPVSPPMMHVAPPMMPITPHHG
jgi:hypothetical protein